MFKPCIWMLCALALNADADNGPKMIAYSAFPSSYLNDHVVDVARLYDGLFFVLGDWDAGVKNNLGVGSELPTTDWKLKVGENLAHLNKAGATENLLGFCFGEEGAWPSPGTLRSDEFTQRLAAHFGAVGKAAKELGFRGVSIDIEYPYERYSFGHKIYTYDGYTAGDLVAAASAQGQAAMNAILDAYPEAVIFVLPGELRTRPIGQAFMLGMLDAMAQRDAPGGFHLGYERSYCLYEGPVSQAGISRAGDGAAELLLEGETLDYWKRRCTVAPGVWPLHMAETGGKDYPVRPWKEELAELDQQLRLLRSVAKRYVWSFTSHPVWCAPEPEFEAKYGIKPPAFAQGGDAIAGWQAILAAKAPLADKRANELVRIVRQYDRGRISFAELCNRFGAPAEWMVLGPLGNPFTHPAFASQDALLQPVRLDQSIPGRDGPVRWFPFRNYEPMGTVSLAAVFDWRNTDDASAQLVSDIHARKTCRAYLNVGWDDGIVVWLDGNIVFDRREYPTRGHGLLFRDRYIFEDRVPISIPKGKSRLGVASINSHGSWAFSLRMTDEAGYPIEGLSFMLPDD